LDANIANGVFTRKRVFGCLLKAVVAGLVASELHSVDIKRPHFVLVHLYSELPRHDHIKEEGDELTLN